MKKNYLTSAFILICALGQALSSASSHAQGAKMSELDVNHDGFISIDEAVADPQILAVFGKIDQNGDGKISSQELADGSNLVNGGDQDMNSGSA